LYGIIATTIKLEALRKGQIKGKEENQPALEEILNGRKYLMHNKIIYMYPMLFMHSYDKMKNSSLMLPQHYAMQELELLNLKRN
jgi:hypothetical protein